MKTCRILVAIALCLGLSRYACAFQMNILDPPPGGTLLTTNTFAAPFSACSAFSSPSAPAGLPSDSYCFEGINATGTSGTTPEVWNSLTITISDPTDVLGLNDASCGTLGGTGLFTSSSCSENLTTDIYTLMFSGGATISTGQSFFIAIETPGVSVGTLDADTTIGAVAGVTPEPNSLVLMASGVGLLGLCLYTERRRLLHNPLRS